MLKHRMLCAATALVLCISSFGNAAGQNAPDHAGMRVTVKGGQRRVDVTYDGMPFTSYVWPTSLKKPVLFPLLAPDGTVLSRGFPLDPRPGERVDHPHHAGMWFNYGNVNGFDFWNNSDAIKPEDREKMGSVRQERILSTHNGADRGDLTVETVWTTGKGQDLLQETTRFVFTHRSDANVIDRITTLKALDRAVFHDDKEGLLGLRVAHFLESANEKGGIYTDATGRTTQVGNADTTGATGVYLTSEGKQGEAAWGTRGKWCLLRGNKDGQQYTIAIFDHPGNPGYPTYWHARGYGLFAANPLGDSIFDPKVPPHNFTLEKGSSATFRYRVLFYNGRMPQDGATQEANTFAAMYK